jgi:S1-C subfamily serine protease
VVLFGLLSLLRPLGAGEGDLFEGGDAMLDRIKKATVSIYAKPTQRKTVKYGFVTPPGGSGSGVVISADGYIMTALHVVDHCTNVYVRFFDRSEKLADVVGVDRFIDIALLRLRDPAGVSAFLKPGAAEEVKVGQRVVAVGNPGNLSTTFTSGIVSFIGRSGLGLWPVEFFHQPGQ